jgi:hypothetical protein
MPTDIRVLTPAKEAKHAMRRAIIPVACLLASLAPASAASPPAPTFLARRDYTGLHSGWVQVADTNGDGIPDLMASFGEGVQVLLGSGKGTFSPAILSRTVMGQISSFAATDLTGGGTIDLVMAGNSEGPVIQYGVGVSLGNGDETFQTGVFYAAGTDTEVSYLAVGDFNGDGIPDVAATGASGVWLFTGNGDGTLNPGVLAVSLPAAAGRIASADFNGDGNLDLVVTLPAGGPDGTGGGFVVLLGNGNGTFQAPQAFSQPKDAGPPAVGSLTKGGYPSIAVNNSNTTDIYLYFGNGAGGFSGPKRTDLPGFNIAIGHANGVPYVVSNGVYIAPSNGKGAFGKPVYYPIEAGGGATNVVLADLRGDGLTDIVTNSYDAVSVLLSEGKGKYEDGEWTAVTGGAGCGAAADFNGDGIPDLAVNNAQGISILLGTGEAATPFTLGTPIPLANAGCLVTGDLNGDGIPDLLVPTPSGVVAYLGKGDGTFTLSSTTTTSVEGYVVVADFNKDGNLDLATSGNLLALGNGDGTFQTPTPIVASPPYGGFSNIATGDINNDGWPDLVLTDANVPLVDLYVLLNNQKGGFTQAPTNFGAETIQAVLVDLDGDGNLDLILSYLTGGGAWVYLGNGRGGFTEQAELVDPMAVSGIVMAADVNGDGVPDIAVLEGDTLAIYLGRGGVTYEPPFFIGTGPSPGDILVENLHGQLPTAGLPDIVAPDTSGGVMVLLNKTK